MKAMHVDVRELAWAAGVFEGDGCIGLSQGKYAFVSLAMSDEDSVRRFHRAVGIGSVGTPYLPLHANKYMWTWTAGTFERAQAVIALLWYGLGERRRARCVEVLDTARSYGIHRPPAPKRPAPAAGTADKRTQPKPRDPLRCRNGHIRTEKNTILRPDGRRECRICNQKTTRESYRRLNNVPATAFRKRVK